MLLADDAGMPDSYWVTDSRVAEARQVLEIPDDGRYTHAHIWNGGEHGQQGTAELHHVG